MQKKYIKWALWLIVIFICCVAAVLHALSTGEMKLSLNEIPSILVGNKDRIEYVILSGIRLPRVILGLAIGGGLSLAGALLQGVFRNPLVEPYTLGISGGAALGVAMAIVFGLPMSLGLSLLPASGFIGALIAMVFVYSLSLKRGKIRIQNMLLIGVMISFICSSAMMVLMAITSSENLHGIIFWIMGSLDEPNRKLITITAIIAFLCLLISYLFVQPLNALRLGEEKARHLGINTDLSIRIIFVIASLLTGICVSIAGVIGFVGLIIPHIVRQVIGPDYRIMLISSFFSGGAFLVLCDTIARTIIAPNELPIGVITGITGGTLFVVIMSRKIMNAGIE